MRKLFVLAALGLSLPLAHAQDKAKAEFTPSAEYRARYFYMKNPGANKDAAANESFAEQRFKLGVNYKANEKFTAHLTALAASDFGSSTGSVGETKVQDTNAQFDTGNEENFLNVNEAYLNWMISDDMSIRIGRQNFQIGDGSVMGFNDWEQNPYAFDGVSGNWEAEFGRFTAFVFNYREEVTGNSASNDPKHTAYGLNFDLKAMPDFLKMVNAHIIKDNADAIEGQSGSTVDANNGQDILRYGVGVGLDFNMVDVKAQYEGQSGKYKDIAAGGLKSEYNSKGMMYQAEVGFKLESFMGSRFFAQYHVDSGDKNATDKDAGTYDPYFYERHENAGLMDIVGWGNLTSMTLGWTMKPMDTTHVGLTYNMFKRTEDGATAAGYTAGRFGQFGTTASTSDKIGDEIDLWAEHRYDGGLSTILRLGYFMPGDYLDSSSNVGNTNMKDNILHVAVEGKLTF